ncbi:hypothetical protein A1Q1_07293 [Trichosporon asahii var. asahii CBS 2479]|uniref:Uncharacterized protein n=1 Tax=Trichosporon asahii var. asahii (strain ATCC 90039 / CBS 2479 / JCM 2466 / KCTC 7840 / NBRC 103889/ NCYC 2677 / UAMH 7654) TaxID=1186058 RepID=J5TLX4_TRIAS|nr:hypothetical protein A1Q1_07293 [Trichosporon asahii var. asahii CBS 2479]EJT51531.1 hypothetical protein A1Q1_07293 [Trichosporon asahii var. asahii CBS 2479]
MLLSAVYLLSFILPALAAPMKMSSELDKRQDGKPDWLQQAEAAHWDCVGTGKRVDTIGQMNTCLQGLVSDAVDNAKAAYPGNNVFAIRTDKGMTWEVDRLTTRASFQSKQWNSEEPVDYHVIVFKGAGTLNLNGVNFYHERNWSAPYAERDGKVVFDDRGD